MGELDELPQFLWNLATKVDWMSEQPCFRSISKQLALFYRALPVPPTHETNDPPATMASGSSNGAAAQNIAEANDKPVVDVRKTPAWVVEHLLFPAFKSALDPPRHWNNKQI